MFASKLASNVSHAVWHPQSLISRSTFRTIFPPEGESLIRSACCTGPRFRARTQLNPTERPPISVTALAYSLMAASASELLRFDSCSSSFDDERSLSSRFRPSDAPERAPLEPPVQGFDPLAKLHQLVAGLLPPCCSTKVAYPVSQAATASAVNFEALFLARIARLGVVLPAPLTCVPSSGFSPSGPYPSPRAPA